MSTPKKLKLPIFEITVLILFLVVVIFIERRRFIEREELLRNRATVVGVTTHCRKNHKSSMHDLYYEFEYKGHGYAGSIKFDRSKRGDICSNVPVLIEFDSISPVNNHAILNTIKY